jgi:dephospho-CoA kinase
MTQPAAEARGDIRSLLVCLIEHEIKMNIVHRVDAKYGSSFQATREYWQKEIDRFGRAIDRVNQTHLRRRGQFFSDAEIHQWKEELIERGIKLAVNRLMKDLRQQGIDGDALWLKKIAEELYA